MIKKDDIKAGNILVSKDGEEFEVKDTAISSSGSFVHLVSIKDDKRDFWKLDRDLVEWSIYNGLSSKDLERINLIMTNFNFYLAQKMIAEYIKLRSSDFEAYNDSGLSSIEINEYMRFYKNFKVPTIDDLKKTAKRLLISCIKEGLLETSTGFLYVVRIPYDDGSGNYRISLHLDLEDWMEEDD